MTKPETVLPPLHEMPEVESPWPHVRHSDTYIKEYAQAFARQVVADVRAKLAEKSWPVGEVVLEGMGVPGSDARQVRFHMYKEIPPVGAKLYTRPPTDTALLEAAIRAERKMSAYVGVCAGDKELTDAVLPALRAAIKAHKGEA